MALKRRWIPLAQAAVSIALLWLAALIARPDELWEELKGANALYLGLALLFAPVLILLRTLRWHMIARTRQSGISLSQSFHSYMAGLALAVVTPWAAGELARGALAAPDDKAGFVGLTLVDKLIDITALFLAACAGLFAVAPGWGKALSAAGVVLVVAAWAAARHFAGLIEARGGDSRFASICRRVAGATRQVPARVLAVSFLAAGANVAVYYCQLYVAMYAFSPLIKIQAVALFPLITLSRVIPSISGLGVREFVAAAIFARVSYEVTSAAAVDASFVQYVMANVVPAALWLLASGGFKRFRRRSGDG